MKQKQDTRPLETYISQVKATLGKLPMEEIGRVIGVLNEARMRGRRVYTFGNGGSAATASHFAGDLLKGAICHGKPRIRAQALVDSMPAFSAWANDTAYDKVFAEQIESFTVAGDVVIGISGSGNSPNVIKGMETARKKGAFTIGFVGFEGGKLKDVVDLPIIVPSESMEQIEDIHLFLCHLITCCLRGDNNSQNR